MEPNLDGVELKLSQADSHVGTGAIASTGVTFAEDWYARGPMKRDWSASTQVDYRSVLDAHLLPTFGPRRIETITATQFEGWRDRLVKDGECSRKTVNKIATQAHVIFEHAVDHFGLATNVASQVKPRMDCSRASRCAAVKIPLDSRISSRPDSSCSVSSH